MQSIVDPKAQIWNLWSRLDDKKNKSYRLMNYVLCVNYKGTVLLHNVVTGQLVILDQSEADLVKALPVKYDRSIEQLIDSHYLVPVDFDEHILVKNIRRVFRLLDSSQNRPVISYTIYPTTGCNARCYYCFEQGTKHITMSSQTAEDAVAYIVSHCGEDKRVHITWFGGEPTLATNRIDQICNGLRKNGIEYHSDMVTNGYLLDSGIVQRASELWNLYHVQISVDGTEVNNNYIKNFINPSNNPYRRVLDNIELLIEKKIHVSIRMNFDIGNYTDFADLVKEVSEKYNKSRFVDIYATPVLGEHMNREGKVIHGNDDWLIQKNVELNDIARKAGISKPIHGLPSLAFCGCSAEDDSYTVIGADGSLARCLELFDGENAVGTITEGVKNKQLLQSWKQIADFEKCVKCTYFPMCIKMQNCPAGERCYHLDRNKQIIQSVCNKYDEYCVKEGVNHEV